MSSLVSSLAALSLLAVSLPAGAAPDPLAGARWTTRVLLVAAPSDRDARLAEQRALFASMRHGAAVRDLALVEVIGGAPGAVTLRQKFGIAPDDFRVLLIGRDGGEKLSSATPLGPDRLFPVIDAMPMRREEMRRKP